MTKWLLLIVVSLLASACIEVETLREQRLAECQAAVNPDQYLGTYTASSDCESAQMVSVTISDFDYVEIEDSSAESGVRTFFQAPFDSPNTFFTDGRIEIDCLTGSPNVVMVIPATVNNLTEYHCNSVARGAGQSCLGFSTLSTNPDTVACTATLQ